MRQRPGWCALFFLSWHSVAFAQSQPAFQGKQITLIVGFAAGGGTDIAGRVIAANLGRHLPGAPNIVVENIPGAEGVTAMNYFVNQVKPDGLIFTMGSGSLGDPVHYRKPQSKYNPTQLSFIAGSGRGGSVLVINNGAAKRLADKTAPTVIMGSTTGIPRSAMLMTTWGIQYLDWNAKWVIGYPGTSNLMLALERGEIDMTSTANMPLVEKLTKSGKFAVLVQTGVLENGRMAAHGDSRESPLFDDWMDGKISDPIQRQAYVYWQVLNSLDKWLALPGQTPEAIVKAYRDGFTAMLKDPTFIENSSKISDDFSPRAGEEVATMVRTLDQTPPEAIAFIDTMLRRQGLATE